MHEITDHLDSVVHAFFFAVLGASFEGAQFHTSAVKNYNNYHFDDDKFCSNLFCRFCSASNGPSNSFSKELSRAIVLCLYSL